jgi:hypothetical protein
MALKYEVEFISLGKTMKQISLLIAAFALLSSSIVIAGTLYTVDESASPGASLYTLDSSNGVATLIGETDPSGVISPSIAGGAYDSLNDRLLFTTFYSDIAGEYGLVDINRVTGLSTYIGIHGSSNVFGTAYDSLNDVLYAFDYDKSRSLATVNRATGETTAIGITGVNWIGGMAYDRNSDTLYGASEDTLYSLNRTTGLATAIGPHGVNASGDAGLAVDPDTGIMYMTESTGGGLYTINMGDGTATLVGATGLGTPGSLAIIPDVTVESEPVPTMSSLGILLLVGLFMLAGFRFRRHAKS